jgi:hypothetical protein
MENPWEVVLRRKFSCVCARVFLLLSHPCNFVFAGDLKRICETELGVISQCCLAKHVFKMAKQYMANVALKINVKVGVGVLLVCHYYFVTFLILREVMCTLLFS